MTDYNFAEEFAATHALQQAGKKPLATARQELKAFLDGMEAAGVAMRQEWGPKDGGPERPLHNDGHHTYHGPDQEAYGSHVHIEFLNSNVTDTLGRRVAQDASEMSPSVRLCIELRHVVETDISNLRTHPVMLHPYASASGWLGHSPEERNLSFAGINSAKIPNGGGMYGTSFAMNDGKLETDFKKELGQFVNQCVTKRLIARVAPSSAQPAALPS